MSDSRKAPFAKSLAGFVDEQISQALQDTGQALPCYVTAVSGQLVTVAFAVKGPWTLPQVQVPIAGAEYIRFPTQVGDKGVVFPADVSLGGVSGMGPPGDADQTIPMGSITALVFFPIGNKNWTAENPNAVVIYAPHQACKLQVTAGGANVTGTAGSLTTQANLSAGNGCSGSFTTPTGQTVMVQNGIITNIF